jgi:hypothetical protein
MAIRFLDETPNPQPGQPADQGASRIRFIDEETPTRGQMARKMAGELMQELYLPPNILGVGKISKVLNRPAEIVREKIQPMIEQDISPGPVRKVAEFAADIGASYLTPAGAILAAIPGAKGRIVNPKKGVLDQAAKAGVPMTPAEVTGSKPLALAESALEKTPLSSGIIQRFREKQAQKLAEIGERLKGKFGTKESAESVGASVIQSVKDKTTQRLQGAAEKLYSRLDDLIPGDAIVDAKNLRGTAEKFINEISQLPAELQDSAARGVLQSLAKVREGGLSWRATRALRARLGELSKFGAEGTPVTGIYKQLRKALDQDIQEFANVQGGPIKKAYDVANLFYKRQKELFGSKNRNIQAIVNKNPEDVVEFAFRPGNVTELKQLERATDHKTFQKVKQAMVNKLFEGKGAPGAVLRTNLNRYGDETLSAVFRKDEIKPLKEFADLSAMAQRAEKLAGNPSGTAQNLITWASGAGAGYFMLRHPLIATAMVVTPPMLAKLYLNPVTREVVKNGFNLSVSAPKAAQIASRLFLGASIMKKREGGQEASNE